MSPRRGHCLVLAVRSLIFPLQQSKTDRLLDNDPPVAGSTAGIMVEYEPLKRRDTKGSEEKDTESKGTGVIGFKGKDAGGLGGKPQVCCDPPLFRHNVTLTPLEKGKGRKGVGHWNQGKETEQVMKAPKPDIPPPMPTLLLLPKAGGNERPTHKAMEAVGSGTTDEPSLWPLPSVGSTFLSSSLFVNPKPINW